MYNYIYTCVSHQNIPVDIPCHPHSLFGPSPSPCHGPGEIPRRTPGIEALSRIHRHPRTATRDVDLRRLYAGFYAGWNGLGILLEFMPNSALAVGNSQIVTKWSWDGRNCEHQYTWLNWCQKKLDKPLPPKSSKYIALQWGLMIHPSSWEMSGKIGLNLGAPNWRCNPQRPPAERRKGVANHTIGRHILIYQYIYIPYTLLYIYIVVIY